MSLIIRKIINLEIDNIEYSPQNRDHPGINYNGYKNVIIKIIGDFFKIDVINKLTELYINEQINEGNPQN